MRWPKGPPHLALNPPCLFFVLFFVPFLSLLLIEKPVFPLEKGIFCLFLSVSLCFSLAFFWPPPFSISLSLSLSSSFLSFFLPVFLFCFLLLPCFCLFLSFSFFFAFVSWKEQHQNIQLQSFSSSYFLFLGISCLAFSLKSLFLIFVFSPDFKLCFCSTSMYLVSKKAQVRKHQFLVKRGVATKRFFLWTCVLQNVKSYRFLGGHFLGKFWLMFKKTL